MKYVGALNSALKSLLEQDERVYILGEDIVDPYGGAFKVTLGLSSAFPERVIATPNSEAALVGHASGMALAGLRPIVEIMFGDFLFLALDQLANHAAKFARMYGADCTCPVVVRAPTGAGRGYGPTHSQSPEKHFLGIPGLDVVAANAYVSPETILGAALASRNPTLIVEQKLL